MEDHLKIGCGRWAAKRRKLKEECHKNLFARITVRGSVSLLSNWGCLPRIRYVTLTHLPLADDFSTAVNTR